MYTGFVYRWTNNINGRYYIGSHKGTTDDGYVGSSKILKRAIIKYGIANFTRTILYEGENFREVEGTYLKTAIHDPLCYNLVDNAGDTQTYIQSIKNLIDNHVGMTGRKQSEETKKKIGAANAMSKKGKPHSQSHRDNISKSQMGRKASDKQKETARNRMTGLARTEEQKAKQSASRLGKKYPHARSTCPHCNKEGGASAMTRYHFDKCKSKPIV